MDKAKFSSIDMMMLYFFLCIFIILLTTLLVLASLGLELGFRKKYVETLLRLFEFGRIKIEKAEERLKKRFGYEDEEEIEQDETTTRKNSVVKKNSGTSVISREAPKLVPEPSKSLPRNRSFNTLHQEFHLHDAIDFLKAGVEAIIEDEVTQRFDAEELPSWNLLTRTNKNYHYISMRLTILWGLGCIIRYLILMPIRLSITLFGVFWMVLCTGIVGFFPEGRLKRFLYLHVSLMCFRILGRAMSASITFHNRENKARGGGICVANHTSPIDVVILACDNAYALVGQSQGGFLGVLERALARATAHIWFERSEIKDRALVAKRLKLHIEDKVNLPILIFPEGTCINNTSVMMFKKGCFEVGGTIYPVAIKYDPRFGDPFWNSSKQGYMHYLMMMMTSWAVVCDVWYLPPMYIREGESAVAFADRVKSAIAQQGGLVDLVWDGGLKRATVKQEWKEQQRAEYSKRIMVNQAEFE